MSRIDHLSTEALYTSDYDLSQFVANQYSLGVSYSDILTQRHQLGWNLKGVDVNGSFYQRDYGFPATQMAIGVRVVHD